MEWKAIVSAKGKLDYHKPYDAKEKINFALASNKLAKGQEKKLSQLLEQASTVRPGRP